MRSQSLIYTAAAIGLFASAAQASVTYDGPITDIDGRTGGQYTGPGSKDVILRRRPWTIGEHDLLLQNIHIHDVLNQKGIDIGATGNPNSVPWTYDNITVRNYDNGNDRRTVGGLHIDGLRISGAGNTPIHKTNVTLDDIHIHDGSTLPINIQDGNYGTIIANHVEINNNDLNQFQVATINTGHVDLIIIENSPGLHLAIMGRPGSIAEVIVRNSPGASVGDVTVRGMRTGARIVYDNSAGGIVIPPPTSPPTVPPVITPIIPVLPGPWNGGGVAVTTLPTGPFSGGGAGVSNAAAVAVPEPSTMGLFAVAGAFLTRRRRRVA